MGRDRGICAGERSREKREMIGPILSNWPMANWTLLLITTTSSVQSNELIGNFASAGENVASPPDDAPGVHSDPRASQRMVRE